MISLNARVCSDLEADEDYISQISLVKTAGISEAKSPFLSKNGVKK